MCFALYVLLNSMPCGWDGSKLWAPNKKQDHCSASCWNKECEYACAHLTACAWVHSLTVVLAQSTKGWSLSTACIASISFMMCRERSLHSFTHLKTWKSVFFIFIKGILPKMKGCCNFRHITTYYITLKNRLCI